LFKAKEVFFFCELRPVTFIEKFYNLR
jgi:hypothetical protein